MAVASHRRPIRLRWLLNALEEQTLAPDRWEVTVAHDCAEEETERLLVQHPLAVAGRLRHRRLPPGSPAPGRNRNAAWRLSRGPTVVFTEDDCRPPADWLARAAAAARRHPGSIVQGATQPDPDERFLEGPHLTSKTVMPPSPYGEASNILYPRRVLERLGGFAEDLRVADDTELLMRAGREGVGYVGDAAWVTYHALDARPVMLRLPCLLRRGDLAKVVGRHPALRASFPLRLFRSWGHALLLPAAAGALLARRDRRLLALAIPWLAAGPRSGAAPQQRLRVLPGRAFVDLVEVAALAYGSVRHHTVFL